MIGCESMEEKEFDLKNIKILDEDGKEENRHSA